MLKLVKYQKRYINNGIVQFLPGDLTSTISFKNEVYPVVVLENIVADEQKLVTLMSSSGRINYSSSNFLRFWRPDFFEDNQMLKSKDRLQEKMKTFSREMMRVLESNRDIFNEITRDALKRDGIIYEEDLFEQVFKEKREEFAEGSFAVHKFLFEGGDWIKDGQWAVSFNGSGPYALRPQWQLELIYETEEEIKKDVDQFRRRVKESLVKKEPFKPSTRFDELILKCLKTFADEFYVNAAAGNNPFKKLVTEAFLGVAIVDSQSQAKELLSKLEKQTSGLLHSSKPLINSYINERINIKDYSFAISSSNTKDDLHDFGDLPVYLIDPIGTVEVDDGISVERTEIDSKVILHVHVADPSDFVTGKVEEQAKFRGETLYLPEIKIPMLPERITNLCTLKSSKGEGVKTLTFSCKINLENGEISDHQIRRGIINNLKHFTYEEAEMIQNDPNLELMKRVREAHLKYRDSKGHLNFSFPRGIAELDRENERILVKLDDNLLMKKVVAESMIIAGRIAGEYLKERNIAGPFRNHIVTEELRVDSNSSLIEKYEILKKLQSASVDFIPRKHDSMGLEAYVKVTSPLRRYLDLVTHKILKQSHKNCGYGIEWFKDNLAAINRQELYNKRLAASVNRFWIEKFIWQQEAEHRDQFWTLTPLEKLKDDMWMVHVYEVANNFMVSVRGKVELGENFKSKIVGKAHETLLKFEPIK